MERRVQIARLLGIAGLACGVIGAFLFFAEVATNPGFGFIVLGLGLTAGSVAVHPEH